MSRCDILIYHNTYLVFVPFPGGASKPLALPKQIEHKVSFVNEMTFGKPVGNLGMEADCQGNQSCD